MSMSKRCSLPLRRGGNFQCSISFSRVKVTFYLSWTPRTWQNWGERRYLCRCLMGSMARLYPSDGTTTGSENQLQRENHGSHPKLKPLWAHILNAVPNLCHYFGRLRKLLGVRPHRHKEPAFEVSDCLMPSLCFLVHCNVSSLHLCSPSCH